MQTRSQAQEGNFIHQKLYQNLLVMFTSNKQITKEPPKGNVRLCRSPGRPWKELTNSRKQTSEVLNRYYDTGLFCSWSLTSNFGYSVHKQMPFHCFAFCVNLPHLLSVFSVWLCGSYSTTILILVSQDVICTFTYRLSWRHASQFLNIQKTSICSQMTWKTAAFFVCLFSTNYLLMKFPHFHI